MKPPTYLEDEYRQLFRNLTYPERVRGIQPDELARTARALGATVLAVDVRTQCYALHDTQVYVKDPLLGTRDLVRETADACRRHGLKFIGYVAPLSFEPWHKLRPEWQQCDAAGQPVARHGSWKTCACWNTGFADNLMAELTEIATAYRPHGFYIDGLLPDRHACYCAACQAKYLKETGRALPPQPDWQSPEWFAYLEWRYRQVEEFARRLDHTIHAIDPRIEIIFNCPHAWCGWYAAQSHRPARYLDRVGTETVLGLAPPQPSQSLWSLMTHAAYRVHVTRMLGSGRKSHAYTYFTPDIPEAEAALEINTVLAAGGIPCIQGCVPFLDRIMQRIAVTEPYLRQATEVPCVGLVFSDLTRDAAYGADDQAFFAQMHGMFRVLMEAHVPFQLVGDHQLENEPLDGFRLLVLPNVTTLPDRAWQRLRAFVSAGGTLLATYQTGRLDRTGRERGPWLLWEDAGLRCRGEVRTEPLYWVDDEGRPQDHIPAVPNQYLVFDGPRQRKWRMDFRALTTGGGWAEYEIPGYLSNRLHVPVPALHVRASGEWKTLIPFTFQEQPAGETRQGVGLAYRRLEHGRIFYLNCDLGALFADSDILLWRRLFERLLQRMLGDAAPLTVKAPPSVYVTLWRQEHERRYVIHLVNDLATCGRPASRARMRTDVVPVDAVLLLRLPGVRHVEQVVGTAALRGRRVAKGYKVILHNIGERVVLAAQ